MQTLKAHPIADIWPLMATEQIDDLANDIRANGQLVPIYLFEGKILDGRNRYEACCRAQITPTTTEYTGGDAFNFAFALNEKRRHLTSAQKAALGVRIQEYESQEAKKRQREAGGDRKSEEAKSVPEKSPEPKTDKGDARDKAAEKAGTNGRYVSQAKKVKEEAPEVFEQMERGEITMKDAVAAVRKKPTNPWLDDEKDRQALVAAGNSVIANAERDKNLIQWAESKGLAIRIDRGSRYGNPFVMDHDGDRDAVCDSYENHYLPHKPSIHRNKRELIGKVLICHCYPSRCHGEALLKIINQSI